MNADTFIKAELAAFCIEELYQHGDEKDMSAIAHVLRNRVNAGWQGGDWQRVIEQAPELRGSDRPKVRGLGLKEFIVREFLREIDSIYDGSAEDTTNGALYYFELHSVTNHDLVHKIVRDPRHHSRVATIGQLSFFR